MLQIQLLGVCLIRYQGQPVTTLNRGRLQSLLAYLLLHPGKNHSRQQLAFLFWPESSDAQAQTNLRQLLHTLRHRLPDAGRFLDIQPYSIRWREDAAFTLDVADFQSAYNRTGCIGGQPEINALEEAVALYTGDLLPDCYDDWILPERERLARDFDAALERLVITLEERREYPAAISYAQRLLRCNPVHEAMYRHLMQMYAIAGDRAAALRIYHTCVTVLEQELGVEPMAATRALYEALLLTEGIPGLSTPIRTSETAFISRHEEFQHILHRWNEVHQGSTHFICITGEAGIGKTRLAEEVFRTVQQQGGTAVRTRAYAAEGYLAYAPIIEMLRTEIMREMLTHLDTVWLAELARLQPELLTLFPGLPNPDPLTEHWQRQRLFEALARAVLADERPTLLVIDDLQWCDQETLEWLHYLLRYDRRKPLLVFTTMHPDEITPDHPADHLLQALRTGDRYAEISLGPLNAEETVQLAGILADRRLPPRLAEQIYHATEGNPLFIVEYVRASMSDMRGAAEPVLLQALPPKVHALVRTRLDRLSAHASEVVSYAAVIGRMFTFDVLAAAWDQDEASLMRGLDELWRRRIVSEHGAIAYDFTHDCIREVAYANLLNVQRRRMHRDIGQALERTHASNLDEVSAQLAHHFEEAGETEKAIGYWQQAADVALHLYAYQEAIALVNRALALVKSLPDSMTHLEHELELQMKLCTAWASSTSYLGKEADAAYNRALEICGQVRNTPHLFTVLWGLHEVALYRAEYRESLRLSHQCLRIAEDLQDSGLLLEARHAMWGPYYFLGEYGQAFMHMKAGLKLYDQRQHEPLSVHYGVHDARSCALYESALALWQTGYLDQAQCRLNEAVAHAQNLMLPANKADALGYAALISQLLRDPVHVQQYAEPALHISNEKGYPFSRFMAAIALGWSVTEQGEITEGTALAHQGMSAAENAGQRLHYSQYAAMLAETCIAAARPTEAISVLDRAITAFHHYRDLVCAPDLWRLKGEALLALNAADDEIECCYQDAISLAQELGAKTCELRAATSLARLHHNQGRTAGGHRLLSSVHAWFSEGFDTPDLRAAQQVLDMLTGLPSCSAARPIH